MDITKKWRELTKTSNNEEALEFTEKVLTAAVEQGNAFKTMGALTIVYSDKGILYFTIDPAYSGSVEGLQHTLRIVDEMKNILMQATISLSKEQAQASLKSTDKPANDAG